VTDQRDLLRICFGCAIPGEDSMQKEMSKKTSQREVERLSIQTLTANGAR